MSKGVSEEGTFFVVGKNNNHNHNQAVMVATYSRHWTALNATTFGEAL